jgi:hypothetical protein
MTWQLDLCLGARRAQKYTYRGAVLEQAEQLKVSVCGKVEHPLKVIKCQFGPTRCFTRAWSRTRPSW